MVKMMPGSMGYGNEIWITSKGQTYLKRLDKRASTKRQMSDDAYWDLQVLSLLWETSQDSPENRSDIEAEDRSGQFSRNPSYVHEQAILRLSNRGYVELA